jgi:hypothetical protein
MRNAALMGKTYSNTSSKAGYRRAWLVFSVLWILAVVGMTFDYYDRVKLFFLVGLLPMAALYALGSAVAWVRRGFARAD